jgi:hypothetical protein
VLREAIFTAGDHKGSALFLIYATLHSGLFFTLEPVSAEDRPVAVMANK